MAATTVVNAAYDTSGNGGRKLVRLSNGWLVATAFDATNNVRYFYVSKDNGATWQALCRSTLMNNPNVSLASVGTKLYVVNAQSNVSILLWVIDVTTQANIDIGNSGSITIDSGLSGGISGVSSVINGAGTEIHVCWSSKVSTLPNSFNIRYAKGTIDGSGNVTWGMSPPGYN